MHSWGDRLDFFFNLKSKGLLREGQEAPDVSAFELYVDAFQELNTCRPSGFGISPIPFTAIVEYSKLYEIEEFDEFLYVIRQMDSELMRLENTKQNKKAKSSNGPTNSSPKNRSKN